MAGVVASRAAPALPVSMRPFSFWRLTDRSIHQRFTMVVVTTPSSAV